LLKMTDTKIKNPFLWWLKLLTDAIKNLGVLP
jgi:hypothetical protein